MKEGVDKVADKVVVKSSSVHAFWKRTHSSLIISSFTYISTVGFYTALQLPSPHSTSFHILSCVFSFVFLEDLHHQRKETITLALRFFRQLHLYCMARRWQSRQLHYRSRPLRLHCWCQCQPTSLNCLDPSVRRWKSFHCLTLVGYRLHWVAAAVANDPVSMFGPA